MLRNTAAMMDSLPNSDGANGLKNSNTQGFLRRAGKNGKAFALRRKRWYKLDGAIFSKHNNEVRFFQALESEDRKSVLVSED